MIAVITKVHLSWEIGSVLEKVIVEVIAFGKIEFLQNEHWMAIETLRNELLYILKLPNDHQNY